MNPYLKQIDQKIKSLKKEMESLRAMKRTLREMGPLRVQRRRRKAKPKK